MGLVLILCLSAAAAAGAEPPAVPPAELPELSTRDVIAAARAQLKVRTLYAEYESVRAEQMEVLLRLAGIEKKLKAASEEYKDFLEGLRMRAGLPDSCGLSDGQQWSCGTKPESKPARVPEPAEKPVRQVSAETANRKEKETHDE